MSSEKEKSPNDSNSVTSNELVVTDLPDEILDLIMSHLTYDQIAKNRIICMKFNEIGKSILNRGCKLLANIIHKYENEFEIALPRRRSARRKHPRYQHFLVMGHLSVRIRILIKAYSEHKGAILHCFAAGQVIDEALRIIHIVTTSERLPFPTFRLTSEFDALVTRANGHFTNTVLPFLKENADKAASNSNALEQMPKETTNNQNTSQPSCSDVRTSDPLTKVQRQILKKLSFRIRKNRISILCVRGQFRRVRSGMNKQIQKLNGLERKVDLLTELVTKILDKM